MLRLKSDVDEIFSGYVLVGAIEECTFAFLLQTPCVG